MGYSDAIFGLVGVAMGGGISGGFQQWDRFAIRRERNLELLTDAVLGVQASGALFVHEADLFVAVLAAAGTPEEVLTHERFTAFNMTASDYLAAIARALILTAGPLQENLREAQASLNEFFDLAPHVLRAIGTPDHIPKGQEYQDKRVEATATYNAFVVGAVEYLQAQRAMRPKKIEKRHSR